MTNIAKTVQTLNPSSAALNGFLFAVPFFILNFIVALRIQPLYSFLGSFPAIRATPLTPLLLLLLFPIGAYIAARPMFYGKRKFYPLNALVAAGLLVIFWVLFTALGEELYRCDVLNIPNCD